MSKNKKKKKFKLKLKITKQDKELFCTFYKLLFASFIAAVIGNIGFEILTSINIDPKYDLFYQGFYLSFRFILPYFIVLAYALYVFIVNGFNKHLQLTKTSLIYWLLMLIGSFMLIPIFALLNSLNRFLTNSLLDTFVWLGAVLLFYFVFAVVYSMAIFFLHADPKRKISLLLFKTFLGLLFIPVMPGIFLDFIVIVLNTVFRALNINPDFFYYSVLLNKIAMLVYPIFVLYYFIKYKDHQFENKWVRVVAYLLIFFFILAGFRALTIYLGI